MKKSKVLSLMTCAAVLSTSFAFVNVATVKAASPVTLKWYIVGGSAQKDQAKVADAMSKYLQTKKHLNVKLDIQCFGYGTYDTKLKTMIGAGENFDICFTAAWANNYQQQAIKGAFIPLNKYFKNELKGTVNALGDTFLNGSKVNGKNYAIPTNKEQAHQWGVVLLKKYVDKYKMNLKNVKTFADLEPLFKIIKAKEPNVTPLEAGAANTCSIYNILDYDKVGDDNYPGAVNNDTKDYKIFNEFADKKFMDGCKLVHKWFKLGYIRPDAATIQDVVPDQKAGKTFCSVQSLKPGKDVEMSNSTGQKWVQLELTKPVIANRDTMGSMQAVSATSKHKLEAVKFLELLNTDKNLKNMMAYGIEGVHYTKVGKNQVKYTASNEKSQAYLPGNSWAIGNQFIDYLVVDKDPAKSDDPHKWDNFLAFNKSAKGTKTLGFMFDPAPVKTQMAACGVVWMKYMPMLSTGSVDPTEYIPQAVDALKAAGSEKVIAEKQKQLNKWLKSNK
jgi:putative aldouronate transport system substrate-binding protein